ncbi:uncharacterized protein LOC108655264 [Drosophila navojoa]|nr:uncharacterized protein LOC108655264 [Drosophila navojoa]
MTKVRRCLSVSPGLVIEIHILLVGVAIFFLFDLYNHASRRSVEGLNTSISLVGLSPRVTLARAITLCIVIVNSILGMRLSRSMTIFKFFVYMLLGAYAAYLSLSIAMSRFLYANRFRYFTDMMLQYLWHNGRYKEIELLYDCCGMHGVIDYILTERPWSKDVCCGLPLCKGCGEPFYEDMNTIERQIARDNIALCIASIIGLVFVLIRKMSVVIVEDPYESESSDYSEDDTSELPPLRSTRNLKKRKQTKGTSKKTTLPESVL